MRIRAQVALGQPGCGQASLIDVGWRNMSLQLLFLFIRACAQEYHQKYPGIFYVAHWIASEMQACCGYKLVREG
jgi:hypothetical protein